MEIDSVSSAKYDVHNISVYIARSPSEIYAFASNPLNLSNWAAGLASSDVIRDGDEWIAEAPFGRVKIRFAAENTFGVMDHDVELDSGVVVHNPMRVVANGDGGELIFTLVRQQGMSDHVFAEDRRAVEQDLNRLKSILETP